MCIRISRRPTAGRLRRNSPSLWSTPSGGQRGTTWIDIRAYPVNDGLALFYRDITTRRLEQERLKRARRWPGRTSNASSSPVRRGDHRHLVLGSAERPLLLRRGLRPAFRPGSGARTARHRARTGDRRGPSRGQARPDRGHRGSDRPRRELRPPVSRSPCRWALLLAGSHGRVDHAADGTPLSFPGVLIDIDERQARPSGRARPGERSPARAGPRVRDARRQHPDPLLDEPGGRPRLLVQPALVRLHRRGLRCPLGWGWTTAHDPAILPEVLSRWNRSLVSGSPSR